MSESKVLTRDAILSCSDLEVEKVSVPEWGGHIFMRVLTGTEKDEYEKKVIDSDKEGAKDFRGLRQKLIAMSACDESGNRIFTDKDIKALGEKSSAVLTRLFEKANELNTLSSDAQDVLEEDL